MTGWVGAFIVCFQWPYEVLPHCFTDRTCAREGLKTSGNQSQNNSINYQFNSDLHDSLLSVGTISPGLLRWKIEIHMTF